MNDEIEKPSMNHANSVSSFCGLFLEHSQEVSRGNSLLRRVQALVAKRNQPRHCEKRSRAKRGKWFIIFIEFLLNLRFRHCDHWQRSSGKVDCLDVRREGATRRDDRTEICWWLVPKYCLPSKNIIHTAQIVSYVRILGFMNLGVGAGEVMSAVQIAMMAELPYTALRDALLA